MYVCFQDGSMDSHDKRPRGIAASLVRFMRQLIGQADGFIMCIALLVAALAVSYTGICRERQKPAKPTPPPVDAVPATKKKVTWSHTAECDQLPSYCRQINEHPALFSSVFCSQMLNACVSCVINVDGRQFVLYPLFSYHRSCVAELPKLLTSVFVCVNTICICIAVSWSNHSWQTSSFQCGELLTHRS